MSRMVVIALPLFLLAGACGGDDGAPGPTLEIEECPESDTPAPLVLETGLVVEFDEDDVIHVACDPGYAASPPSSGSHFDAWQNCGFYTAAIRDYTAVHALEHGAVWIAYRADTTESTLGAIAATVESSSHLLAAPYPGLQNAIVLTAWRRQLAVDEWDDPLVDEFIGDFAGRGSPTAPEAGASCEDAIGSPPDAPDAGYAAILADVLSR